MPELKMNQDELIDIASNKKINQPIYFSAASQLDNLLHSTPLDSTLLGAACRHVRLHSYPVRLGAACRHLRLHSYPVRLGAVGLSYCAVVGEAVVVPLPKEVPVVVDDVVGREVLVEVVFVAENNSSETPKAPNSTKFPPVLKYGTGALATMGACIFSNPLEVIKTRMQLQGEMQSRGTYVTQYRNVFHAGYVIVKNEGIRGIQKGLVLGLCYQAVMNGSRLGGYDLLREKYTEYTGKQSSMPVNIITGAVSGAFASFLGSPFYLVKTQQQAQCAQTAVVGYQESGVPGLWRGVTGSIPRLVVGSSVQLSTYSKCRQLFEDHSPLKQGVLLHFSASMLAGMFVAVAMNPFDVITTRMYNQPVDPKTKKGLFYRNVFDCFSKTVRAEGIRGMYKGLMALYLRLGPHTVLTFVFWEQLRKPFEDVQLKL
eukprot:gene2555-5474_t